MWHFIFGGYRSSGHGGGHGQSSSVPEMDATSGVLAIAVVFAALALVWEIKRRRRARF